MRIFILSMILIAVFSCSSSKNTKSSLIELNGTWLPIKQEMGGKALPAAFFEKQKLVINKKMYSVFAESVDKGELVINNGKIDIYGKEGVNAGKHFTALYQTSNGQLSICYNLSGDSYPESLETKTNPKLFLSVYKKE